MVGTREHVVGGSEWVVGTRERLVVFENGWWGSRMSVGLETSDGVRKRLVVVREWVVGFENAGLGLRARGTVREWVVQ